MPLFSKSVYAGYTLSIPFPAGTLTNAWTVGGSYLSHTKNIKTEITKYISTLKLNTYYKIRYEVYDYVNCTVQLKVGSQLGTTRTSNGVYTEYFTISTDLDRSLTFIADGILKVRNIEFEEKEFTVNELSFEDKDKFENKSWTISYSMRIGKWISWHSYLPNFYISSQNSFYSFIASSNSIWKHNQEGKFHTFYGIHYPHYIELVQTSPIQDVITEDITIQTRARTWSAASRQYLETNLITYDTITAYNSRQNSGEQDIVVKSTQANPELWYEHQIQSSVGKVMASRNENNWNINDLRDYVVDYGKPMFSSAWIDTKNSYFIDKIPDNSVISFSKSWHELESFRDKFIIVRLKFSIFDDVNLILNYSLTTEQNSVR